MATINVSLTMYEGTGPHDTPSKAQPPHDKGQRIALRWIKDMKSLRYAGHTTGVSLQVLPGHGEASINVDITGADEDEADDLQQILRAILTKVEDVT